MAPSRSASLRAWRKMRLSRLPDRLVMRWVSTGGAAHLRRRHEPQFPS